jgi:hypothetical protein
VTDEHLDPMSDLEKAAEDTSEADPTPDIPDLPDDIRDSDLAPFQPFGNGVPQPDDPEERAAGFPLSDDDVSMLTVDEED